MFIQSYLLVYPILIFDGLRRPYIWDAFALKFFWKMSKWTLGSS